MTLQRSQMSCHHVILAIFIFAIQTPGLLAQGRIEILAESGTPLPGQKFPIEYLGAPVLNGTGNVIFGYGVKDSLQFTEWRQGQYEVLFRQGDTRYRPSRICGYSDDGLISLWVQGGANWNVWHTYLLDRATGSWLEFHEPDSSDPDGNGLIWRSWIPHMSRNGTWVAAQQMKDTKNGLLDNFALSTVNGLEAPVRFIREGDSAPGGEIFRQFRISYDLLTHYSINNFGQVGFPAVTEPNDNELGLYFWNGTSIQEIVRNGVTLSNGDKFKIYDVEFAGTVHTSRMGLNDSGQLAFHSKMEDSKGNVFYGVYMSDKGAISEQYRLPKKIAGVTMKGVASSVQLNNSGHMAFAIDESATRIHDFPRAIEVIRDGEVRTVFHQHQLVSSGTILSIEDRLGNQSPGFNNYEPYFELNEHGAVFCVSWIEDVGHRILLGDGIDVIEVADESEGGLWVHESSLQGANSFNDFGQVAYLRMGADTESRQVKLFTPNIFWRTNRSGEWDNKNNWTLGLPPDEVHDVSIASESDTVVNGPGVNTTLRNLNVGGDPAVRCELRLQSNNALSIIDAMTVLEGGILSGTGAIEGDVAVFGELSPGDSSAELPGELTFNNSLTLHPESLTAFDIAGVKNSEFDRLVIHGAAKIDGSIQISFSDSTFIADGQQFVLGDFIGTAVGHFADLPEGAVIHSSGSLQVQASYLLGNGNDFGLMVVAVDEVAPSGVKLLDGVPLAGSLSDTSNSDDVYYELNPSPTSNPVKQKIDMILLGETTVTSPSSISFRLEAAMSGGLHGDVIQTIELWNESTQQWELLDSRPAYNSDSTVHVTANGDLTRFVHPNTGEVLTRIEWVSPEFAEKAFEWSIDIDQAGWLIN